MNRISVVIPCHNYGRFLAEAVESVTAQSRAPDEVVIVDDGSTDDTAEVARALEERMPALRVISRAPARGPATTFNDGVRATTGNLVVILSADDRLSTNYLELTERRLDDSSISFAYTDAHLFGAESGVLPAGPFDRRELMRENLCNGSAMFRRTLFDELGGFRSDFDKHGLEDWEFWVNAVSRDAIGSAVNECWIDYRRHPTGSRNTLKRTRVLRAHLKVWRLHRDVVRPGDLGVWMLRSARRNLYRTRSAGLSAATSG
ncbi:MAG: glycosyltransferase family 2 protein [Actinomycetota bacterium]|nr:glycosyltransferase family 2 protein [Actinomycetota bacterium]MDQ6947814.1 glycosyltransferase family 2 protein [Actinomycetota bacterium]